MLTRIQERARTGFRNGSKGGRQQARLLLTTFEVGSELPKSPERRRTCEQYVWGVSLATSATLAHEIDESPCALCDVHWRRLEAALQIVRTEHEDRKIQRMV